jgi:hypothetical protein
MPATLSPLVGAEPNAVDAHESRRTERYELRFARIGGATRGFSVPCDAQGSVDLDALAEVDRNDYFFARTVIGREFHAPRACRVSAAAHR